MGDDVKTLIELLNGGGSTVAVVMGWLVWRYHKRLERLERKVFGVQDADEA